MTIQSLLSYLSIVKVARRMKVTRTSVLRWIQNGYLPAVKSPFDGRWLIHPDDLSGFQRPPIGNPEWIDRR